jgi:glutathione S-transferase
MLVLEEKGLGGYGNKLLSFDKKEHKGEEVLKWNPRGLLPTLVYDNAFAINESIAASEFLERTYASQGTKLTPTDPKLLALMLQRKAEVLNLERKSEDLIHYKRMNETPDPEKLKTQRTEFFEEIKLWDNYTSKTPYLVGDTLTLADLTLLPTIALNVRCGLDLPKHAPHLSAWYQRLIARPSVVATWPPHWKGTDGPAVFQ